jgi:hypothetical protein
VLLFIKYLSAIAKQVVIGALLFSCRMQDISVKEMAVWG